MVGEPCLVASTVVQHKPTCYPWPQLRRRQSELQVLAGRHAELKADKASAEAQVGAAGWLRRWK